MPNSIEVIRPFAEELRGTRDVQLMGGIGSKALEDPRTYIDVTNQRLIAPSDLNLPNLREDGTQRDVDVLVTSADDNRVTEVAELLAGVVGGELKPSVFGLKSSDSIQEMVANPLGGRALTAWGSDRYVYPDGEIVKALFPFQVPINPESIEPWELEIGTTTYTIPNPAMSLLNYTQRSVSGLRPKDRNKVERVAQRLTRDAPSLIEWITDGPGASQLELTHIINSLRKRPSPSVLPVAIRYTQQELLDHEAFLLPESPRAIQNTVLALTAFKANGIAFFEKYQGVRTVFQGSGVEQSVSGEWRRSKTRK